MLVDFSPKPFSDLQFSDELWEKMSQSGAMPLTHMNLCLKKRSVAWPYRTAAAGGPAGLCWHHISLKP